MYRVTTDMEDIAWYGGLLAQVLADVCVLTDRSLGHLVGESTSCLMSLDCPRPTPNVEQ